jgi:hypothetical protein
VKKGKRERNKNRNRKGAGWWVISGRGVERREDDAREVLCCVQ